MIKKVTIFTTILLMMTFPIAAQAKTVSDLIAEGFELKAAVAESGACKQRNEAAKHCFYEILFFQGKEINQNSPSASRIYRCVRYSISTTQSEFCKLIS